MKFYGPRLIYEDLPCWITKRWKIIELGAFLAGAIVISAYLIVAEPALSVFGLGLMFLGAVMWVIDRYGRRKS